MKTMAITALLSAAAAFAAATWVYRTPESPAAGVAGSAGFDATLPAEARIAALEQAVDSEREARQLLQDQVLDLNRQLDALRDAGNESAADTEADTEAGPAAYFEARRQAMARRNSPEGRAARLVDAGFQPGMADWIVRREQELQMEALQARYDAGREGDPGDFFREQLSVSQGLRQELGDADFERYLEANGRPVNVGVSSVIGSSPAETAGIQPGDEIVRYGGERVFGMEDINAAVMKGDPGQAVTVDILRDGVPMQVVVPRGPLGISSGRRRR